MKKAPTRGFQPSKSRTTLPIPGTKVSAFNPQLIVTSTGVPSLDELFGGGISIGSLLLVEEDRDSTYAHHVLRCAIAEGAWAGHEVVVASLDRDPKHVLASAPSLRPPAKDNSSTESEDLQIAWRYAQQKKVQSEKLVPSRSYSFKERMLPHLLECVNTFTWGRNARLKRPHNPYMDLFCKLNQLLEARKLRVQDANARKGNESLMRIVIDSCGSPAWEDMDNDNNDDNMTQLTTFLPLLSALLKESYAIGVISLPSKYHSPDVMNRLYQYSHFIIQLKSFKNSDSDSSASESYKDYDGTVEIKRTYAGLVSRPYVEKDLVFRVKRDEFVIETFHLPPSLGDENEQPSSMCDSGAASDNSALDF